MCRHEMCEKVVVKNYVFKKLFKKILTAKKDVRKRKYKKELSKVLISRVSLGGGISHRGLFTGSTNPGMRKDQEESSPDR